eukprot:748360-Hanusia_phi.AAC.1
MQVGVLYAEFAKGHRGGGGPRWGTVHLPKGNSILLAAEGITEGPFGCRGGRGGWDGDVSETHRPELAGGVYHDRGGIAKGVL